MDGPFRRGINIQCYALFIINNKNSSVNQYKITIDPLVILQTQSTLASTLPCELAPEFVLRREILKVNSCGTRLFDNETITYNKSMIELRVISGFLFHFKICFLLF